MTYYKLTWIISVFILCFGQINKTLAETSSEQKCGDNCYWEIINDTLIITGSGKMSDYNRTTTLPPWKNDEDFTQVKNVIIDGITSVGDNAFWNTKITTLTMSDTVTDIRTSSFAWTNLTDIKLSDSLKYLRNGAFRGVNLLEITLPANVSIGTDSLGQFEPNIVCKGTTKECKKLYDQLQDYVYKKYEGETVIDIPQDLSQKMVVAEQSNCDSTNYYWSGTSCLNKKNGINCAENWKQIEDFCNRLRYTPAETAAVLHDDNTNEITITFKK